MAARGRTSRRLSVVVGVCELLSAASFVRKRCQQGRRCFSTRPIGGATIFRREEHHESGGSRRKFWVGCGAWDCHRAISAAGAGAAGRTGSRERMLARRPDSGGGEIRLTIHDDGRRLAAAPAPRSPGRPARYDRDVRSRPQRRALSRCAPAPARAF
jgi:hypothetical protein